MFDLERYINDKECLENAVKYFEEKKKYLAEINFYGMVYHDIAIKLLKDRIKEHNDYQYKIDICKETFKVTGNLLNDVVKILDDDIL